VDAFQYFLGRGAQPVPTAGKVTKDSAERKPRDAFEYLFGKDRKADTAEEQPESPPPI
jgi:hypothetical protein